MLIRFAVENYNSFKEQQVFNMVAGKQTRHSSHCLSVNGKRLLKSSFFFGANASGKSNFVRAIDFVRRVTLFGVESIKYNDRFFRIDSSCKDRPGVFQIDFIADDIVFSYGFAINYLTREFTAEWLYRIDSPNSETCVFEREGASIVTKYNFSNDSKTRFNIYCEDLKASELLLSDIGNKNFDKSSDFNIFTIAYNWFKNLIIIYPDSYHTNKNEFFLNRASNTDYLTNMLKTFDTGIEGITKGKQLAENAFSFLPDDVKKNLLTDLDQKLRGQGNIADKANLTIEDSQFEVYLEDGEIYAEKIMLDHGNPNDLFEISDESDGTKRLFDLIPVYEIGQHERVIIIDELDRSFHSKLTEEYIEKFFEVTKDKKSQLICTTHDLNLMDLNILRQDEIWFIERESDHSSKIYSLSDFKERFDKNILNEYLIGRYGAIPCIQDDDIKVEH